ncbi:MAG: TrkH family potassium uptake protein, partial [Deltaproteobacteria bacterium]|nr:TrkH family potassium uptake protein [Deltaproteobacteria bacterium]
GASPGSCGGGVKTTTLAVFWAVVRARLKNEARPRLFNRSLPPAVINKCLTLVISAALITGLFTVLILNLLGQPRERGLFLETLFEATSALGTVGLSLGLTPKVSPPAKALLMVLMFVGRLGPLTLAYLFKSEGRPDRFFKVEESVMIG